MNLFVVSFFGLIAISIVQTRQIPIHEDTDSLERNQQNYEYKQVILYLRPSEVKALERSNILQKSNNEYYSTYQANKLLSAQKEEGARKNEPSKIVKPIRESQETEETTDKNEKLIDIPLFYPFELIPLNINKNNNKEKQLEKENENRLIEEYKKKLQEERENAKIENEWRPMPQKQNTQQIKTVPQQENKVKTPPEYLKLIKAANNLDNKNVLTVQDFYRLQYELGQINKNNQAVEELLRQPTLKAQQPLFVYQSQQINVPENIRFSPPLQNETPAAVVDIEKHHLRETKRFFDARRPHPLRDLYRE